MKSSRIHVKDGSATINRYVQMQVNLGEIEWDEAKAVREGQCIDLHGYVTEKKKFQNC